MMAIEGAIVTIDAMGCQRNIAQKVIDQKADYVLALKGNQGALREDVEVFVAEQKATGFQDTEISRDTTIDGDHGRIETRTTTVIHDVTWLQERHQWPGLKGVVMVDSVEKLALVASRRVARRHRGEPQRGLVGSGHRRRERDCDQLSQFAEVLGGGGEVKLIARTARPA
jgi:predicted transposase YbfD/YdcC